MVITDVRGCVTQTAVVIVQEQEKGNVPVDKLVSKTAIFINNFFLVIHINKAYMLQVETNFTLKYFNNLHLGPAIIMNE